MCKWMKLLRIMLLLTVFVASVLSGCAAEETATEVIVDQSTFYATVGEPVMLPAAAVTYKGQTVAGEVVCTVYNGSQELAEFDGLTVNAFLPEKAGVYVAEYQATYADTPSLVKQVRFVAEQGPDLLAGMPAILVEQTELILGSDDTVTLRAATGRSSSGEDISADIEVVLLDCVSNVVFSGKGDAAQEIGTLDGGTYIAVYTLEDGGLTDSTGYFVTVVNSENIVPGIDAPTTDVRMFVGQTLKISSARASDPIEGDISSALRVRIETADGKTVFPDAPADRTNTYTFSAPGEYRVVYTCHNSKGKEAPTAGYAVTVRGSTASGILLDGRIEELEYAKIPSYRTGLGGNAVFYFHQDENYLYIAAEITDTTLTVRKVASAEGVIDYSDGIELLFDPQNSKALNAKGTNCVRIRIAADGSILTYTPAKSGTAWKAADLPMSGNYAVKTSGTVSLVGVTKEADAIASDLDVGYTVEARIPWKHLGFDKNPAQNTAASEYYMSMAFGHRDVSSPQYNYTFGNVTSGGVGSGNNCFYNGMHYKGRAEVATQGLCPLYYEKLYLGGENLGVNPVVYSEDIILDGYMEDSFWSDAKPISYGTTSAGSPVDAFVKTDESGVYLGVYIHDAQMVAEPRSFHSYQGIKYNDRLDLRIVDEMSMYEESLPSAVSGKPNITNGKILFMDPTGAAQMHMLQAASGRSLAQLPYAYATVTNGTVGYSQNGNLWNADGTFIADTNIDDTDAGWGVEVFVPWSTLGMSYPKAGDTAKIAVFVSILDRNADPTGAAMRHSLVSATGRARSATGNPSSYSVVEIEG